MQDPKNVRTKNGDEKWVILVGQGSMSQKCNLQQTSELPGQTTGPVTWGEDPIQFPSP